MRPRQFSKRIVLKVFGIPCLRTSRLERSGWRKRRRREVLLLGFEIATQKIWKNICQLTPSFFRTFSGTLCIVSSWPCLSMVFCTWKVYWREVKEIKLWKSSRNSNQQSKERKYTCHSLSRHFSGLSQAHIVFEVLELFYLCSSGLERSGWVRRSRGEMVLW